LREWDKNSKEVFKELARGEKKVQKEKKEL